MYKIIWSIIIITQFLFGSLSQKDLDNIKYHLRILESQGTGDLNAINSRGYLGRYQMGASALAEVGLVKKNIYKKSTRYDIKSKKIKWKKGLNNKLFLSKKTNWNLSNGKYSFLGNEILQENAIDALILKNYKLLQKTSLNLSHDETLNFLKAAHLGGFTHAYDFVKNHKNFKDGFGTKISKYFSSNPNKSIQKKRNDLINIGKKYLGGKYVWGGTNPKGFDCSGYTQFIFNRKGIKLPRTALSQSRIGAKVSLNNLKKGDLLFFNTDKSRGIPVSHVGVYLEKGKFIHAASTKKGIIISPLSQYKKSFVVAKRVLSIKNNKRKNMNESFFNPMAKKAASSSTKVLLSTNAYRYKLINGRYEQIK